MQHRQDWSARETARLLREVRATPREALLKDLLRGNGQMHPLDNAEPVPEGYRYVGYTPRGEASPIEGETVAYGAHPSDVSADFAFFLIQAVQAQGGRFQQVLVTRGENGAGLPEAEAIELRLKEEEQSAALAGIGVDYLRALDGSHFPDGKLIEHLTELTNCVKRDIAQKQPGRVILHSPSPDHPDHLAVNIAVANAIVQLRDEGYFKNRSKIEMLACEPEFGSALGHWKRDKDIPEEYGGRQTRAMREKAGLKLDPDIRHYRYAYRVDEPSGLVYPASDLSAARTEELSEIAQHAFAVPAFIRKISDAMQARRMAALVQHESQIKDRRYGHLIPGLDRVRGEAAGAAWGTGLYPVHIAGATVEGTPFIDALPRNSVVQLKQEGLREISFLKAALHERATVRADAGCELR